MNLAKPSALETRGAKPRRTIPLALALFALVAGRAIGAPEAGEEKAGPPSVVQRLLDTPYLTDSERADIRVRHGIWTDQDLTDVARRARAAITRGAWDDPALADTKADPLDRAEALILRGQPADALQILNAIEGKTQTLRALRLIAMAQSVRGEKDAAIKTLAQLEQRVIKDRQNSAWELVEGVRGLHLKSQIEGPARGAQDFQSMMSMLARAREQLDRLCWTAPLEEAMLLAEKDNRPEAAEALEQALDLNASAAEAYYLLGRMSVDSFNFDQAEKISEKLRELAGPIDRAELEPVGTHEAGEPVAPYADMLQARLRLRQRDPQGAIAALKPTLTRFPGQLEARALEAAAIAAGFDMPGADRALAELDRLSPNTPLGYLYVGKALSEQRQYADAARYLEEATKRAPRLADAWIELGLLEVQAARDERALAALEKAEALDPFNVRAANSLKLVRDVAGFSRIESDHFIVRYRPGVDLALAREMPPILERIYARVTGDKPGGIRYPLDFKTVIELMPDHQWFSVRITGMPKVHTMAAATGPLIAMEAPRLGEKNTVGAYDWARVVQHEFTHTVTLARTSNRLPHWFTEASAVYLEDAPRDWTYIQILARAYETDTLFDLDDINIAFTRPKKPSDRSQAYGQGAWMYEYIVRKYGPEAPLKLMDRYAAGDREPEAFQTVLGVSREQFLDEFKAWAGEQLIEWGMRPKPGQPELLTLLEEWRTKLGEGHEEDPPTIEVVDAWLKDYPDHADLLEVAVKLRVTGNKNKASPEMIPLIEAFSAARPGDPTPHKLLAALFLDESSPAHDAAKAIPHLEFLDAREQNSASLSIQLARLYAEQGQWDRAWAKAIRACTVAPYEASNREFAATIAIKRGDFDAAKWQLEALQILEPDRPIHAQRLKALEDLKAKQK
ncbi:MAG: tetratricopeptide repeat protein [Phycisphaeraceae bacterium]|nr:tetratricopeptide repeat protein [Phycisphaeraceae bacterium]